MTRVAVKLNDSPVVSSSIVAIHQITGSSIGQLRCAVERGSAIFHSQLFGNNHDDVALVLRRLMGSPLLSTQLKFYELDDDTDPDGNFNAVDERSSEVIENILQKHEFEVFRQQQT